MLAPEDIVVMKAMAVDEESPWHWYDALGILAAVDLDWDYLVTAGAQVAEPCAQLVALRDVDRRAGVAAALRRLHEVVAMAWDAS